MRCWFAPRGGWERWQELDLAFLSPDEVLGLDVAMDHAFLESVLEADCRLAHVVTGVAYWKRPCCLNELADIDSLDKLHDKKMKSGELFRVVGRHDVRMGQSSCGDNLLFKAFDTGGVINQVSRDYFQGNQAPHDAVLGLVDRAHSASAK